MAFSQDSKIQESFNPGAAAPDIDYGPYSGDQWARLWRINHTSSQHNEQGVVRGYRTEFVVSTVGTTAFVEPGAGWCNGHFLVGVGTPDWQVAITPPTAGHTRCDYVVMLENNTVGVYAPGAATMQTPNSADYGGIANQVPEFACRLAVIKGAEDAACPPAIFTQTTALFMVPLASIEWDVAQGIATVTDLRHYVHEYTRTLLLQPTAAHNVDTQVNIPWGSDARGWFAADGVKTTIHATWQTPRDYVHGTTVALVHIMNSATSGNIYGQPDGFQGKTGQIYNSWQWGGFPAARAMSGGNVHDAIEPVTITPGVVGVDPSPGNPEHMLLQYTRLGDNVLDTLGDDVYFVGFQLTYTGALVWL